MYTTSPKYYAFLKLGESSSVVVTEVTLGAPSGVLELKGEVVKYSSDGCAGDRYVGGNAFFNAFGLDVNGNVLRPAGEDTRGIYLVGSQSYGGLCQEINNNTQNLTRATVVATSLSEFGIILPISLKWK